MRLRLEHRLLRLLGEGHRTGLLRLEGLRLRHRECGHLRLKEPSLLRHHRGLAERVEGLLLLLLLAERFLLAEELLLTEGLMHLLGEALRRATKHRRLLVRLDRVKEVLDLL